jgi:hypothetical protein
MNLMGMSREATVKDYAKETSVILKCLFDIRV